MLHAFQWDLARQVERLDWLLGQLPRYSAWGYNELYLHLEDAVDYPGLPGVARSDAYSWRDFERLVTAAGRHGIGVVPIVNLLGHTQYLIKADEWRDLNELRQADGSPAERGQLCPLHPRTAEVAERLLADVAPFCTAGKVHVGLDESFHLGRHPLSRAEIADVGLASHFARYVRRLHGIVASRGLRLGMWADMLAFIPEAIPELPPDIIAYDWYYHAFRRHPRVELFNFAECDLATPLQARGIEYWGCAMSSGFRHEPLPVFGERLANALSWWRRCHQVGAGGFLVTSWESNRLAMELVTVVDAAIATLWLEPDVDDQPGLLARGFQRVFDAPKRSAETWARAALRADDIAFAGYARWELNDRWDIVPSRDGLARSRGELRAARRLSERPGLPESLQASLSFRRYLAERDVFLRQAVRGVHRLRREVQRGRTPRHLLDELCARAAAFARTIQLGRRAARRMWLLTRNVRSSGQNEHMLAADRVRLTRWRRWLARCAKDPAHVWAASPVAAPWQLEFTVQNFAPAVQRVVVEQRRPDGTWQESHARFTIEFRTNAARPRAKVRRTFVAPLDTPDDPVRIAVRGIGQVQIAQVELTNGVEVRPALGFGRSRVLGNAAPTAGWPELDVNRNVEAIDLRF